MMERSVVRVLVIVVFALTFFVSTAIAQCPEGKVAWTIVNPAGKVVVICVPDHVTGIGGPNDIAIPASCPCFSQEDIEVLLNKNPNISCTYYEGTTSGSDDPCSFVFCVDGLKFYAVEGPDYEEEETCVTKVFTDARLNQCTEISQWASVNIDEDQADACVEILKTFVPSGDDCSDPIVVNPDPDVKPTIRFGFAGDTTSANDDYDFKSMGIRSPDVVYTLKPISELTKKPTVSITATPGDWDLVLYVVEDCNDLVGSFVEASDNNSSGGAESVVFGMELGKTYYVIVDGAAGRLDRGQYILVGSILGEIQPGF